MENGRKLTGAETNLNVLRSYNLGSYYVVNNVVLSHILVT